MAMRMTVTLEKRAGETNVLKERLKFFYDERDSLQAELEKETLNKENSLKIIETNEALKTEKQNNLRDVNYKLVDLSDKHLKIVAELTKSEDEAAAKQKEMIDELSKMTDIKSNISALTAQKEAYLNNITYLEGKIYTLQGKIKEKESALQTATSIARKAEETHTSLQQQHNELQTKIQSAQNQLK